MALSVIELRPRRPAVSAYYANADMASVLVEYHQEGDWDRVISLAEPSVRRFVNDFPEPVLSGIDALKLYVLSRAYRATGASEKYWGCLKVLYSLRGFESALGDRYGGFVADGAAEYEALAEEIGSEQLNALSVESLFPKRSGCFIATSACGSSEHPDVVTLSRFRDAVLVQSKLGRAIVRGYYAVSPTFARVIEGRQRCRRLVARVLVAPAARIAGAYVGGRASVVGGKCIVAAEEGGEDGTRCDWPRNVAVRKDI